MQCVMKNTTCEEMVHIAIHLLVYRQHNILKPMTDARETHTRNSHETEHALFDVRNLREKYLAASRYDTCTSFLRVLTCTNFSYVGHGIYRNKARSV